MRVILTQDVPNLGDMGDIVKVADGYGRNYLIPKGYALRADEKNAKLLKHQLKQIERKREALRKEALSLVERLDNLSITIPRQAGEKDRLYGSVTNRDIESALEAEGFKVDRKKILIDKPIRELGVYRVKLKLQGDIQTHILVWVTAI